MIHIEVDEQELFEMIMALHAFQKSDAQHSVEGESRNYQDLAQRRAKLLEKLHDAFEEQTMSRKHDASVAKILEMHPRGA